MISFIVENYYVILVVCILSIFAIIGYIIDTLKTKKYEEKNAYFNAYVPDEEIFIQKFEESENEEKELNDNIDNLLKDYNE